MHSVPKHDNSNYYFIKQPIKVYSKFVADLFVPIRVLVYPHKNCLIPIKPLFQQMLFFKRSSKIKKYINRFEKHDFLKSSSF